MKIINAIGPRETAGMNSQTLREQFLLDKIFEQGQIHLAYTHYDRMVIGGAVPQESVLLLQTPPALRAAFFLERRELGIINTGGPGSVTAGDQTFHLDKLDCLYLGKGTETVQFSSDNPENPACFYLLSAPAHHVYPNRLMRASESNPNRLGAAQTANERTIYKYIHPDGIESCQLVMGLTILESGNVWNTMPPHTHDRRMEVYCYFDLPENQRVLHLMGEPSETRHLWVGNYEPVISPPWSIHAGCGTSAYTFIWGMAGENQSFTDMDQVGLGELK